MFRKCIILPLLTPASPPIRAILFTHRQRSPTSFSADIRTTLTGPLHLLPSQFYLFWCAKQLELPRKINCFTTQNKLYYHARQIVLQEEKPLATMGKRLSGQLGNSLPAIRHRPLEAKRVTKNHKKGTV